MSKHYIYDLFEHVKNGGGGEAVGGGRVDD
jgi:hypothetical protein